MVQCVDEVSGVIFSDMQALFNDIHSLLDQGQFDSVNELLETAVPVNMTPIEMVALLRYSYAVRHHLANWNDLLARVGTELQSRNLDVNILLRGL